MLYTACLERCTCPCVSSGLEEVEFPRRFQEKELKETSDNQYKMFLLHGIAFLSLFTDEKLSARLLKEVEKYNSFEGYCELKKVRNLIEYQQGKLLYKPKKQIGKLELKK